MALDVNSDKFNEAITDDNTSTPPIPGFATLERQGASPVLKALQNSAKVKIKPPGMLASAIAKSRRAHPSTHKWGN